MNGFFCLCDGEACPPIFTSPIKGMENITNNQVLSVIYKFPPTHKHITRPPNGVINPKKSVCENDVNTPTLWHDREKEMAAVLLSSLYADVIEPEQVSKGFRKLLDSADDLAFDIPKEIDILALFVAHAVVDDILPPDFLTKTLKSLPEDSKRVEVIQRKRKAIYQLLFMQRLLNVDGVAVPTSQ